MKINLTRCSSEVRGGFHNLDPFAGMFDQPEQTMCDPNNFDFLCADNEAEEIVARNILDYYPEKVRVHLLSYWNRKMRKKGTLTIGGLEYGEVFRLGATKQMPLEQINLLLFGSQSQSWELRRSVTGLEWMRQWYLQHNYLILHQSIEKGHFLISGERQ